MGPSTGVKPSNVMIMDLAIMAHPPESHPKNTQKSVKWYFRPKVCSQGPVTVRRRSAAQGCANAHTDDVAAREAAGSVESTSARGKIRGLKSHVKSD